MITLYGIKNCDTVKKARKALDDAGIDYRFQDYRKDGVTAALLERFAAVLGWEALLNTRGTTCRKLGDDMKAAVDESKAIALMVAHDGLIKRPVWEKDGSYRLGFAPKEQDEIMTWAAQ